MASESSQDDVTWRRAAAALSFPHHAEAMAAGAECWRCALANCGAGPVPPSVPSEPYSIELLVVAEAPGQTEIDEGRTLIGPTGREVRTSLAMGGADPNMTAYTNTMLCRPPGGDLKRFQQDRKRAVKNEAGENKPSTDDYKDNDPIECCRPRLMREIKRAKYAMLMGAASLVGANIGGSIMKLRGTPVRIPDGPPAMPILHAAFVMRDQGRHLRGVSRADVAKGIRLSRGGNTWVDPPYFVVDNHAQLANFLSQDLPWWGVDTETDSKDPWTCRIRRIGIGSQAYVAIYRPLSVHGHYLMPDHEREACKRVFNEFFARASTLVFHNYYGFDSIVLTQNGFMVPDDRTMCTLIGHHVGPTSELPHGLDFLGSVYTDAPYWKDDVKHSNVKSDEVLDKYLSYDIAVTWTEGPHVRQSIEQSQQSHIFSLDTYTGQVGRSMSRLGIRINREKQFKFASEYQAKADKMLAEFRGVAEQVGAAYKDINPASPVQVRKLLYQGLGLPMLEEFETQSGEISTAEPVLLELLGMGVDKRAETVIKSLLGFREAEKILGTYTGRIEDGKLVGGPPLHPDGRLRTTWKVHGTVTGRWSSGDPVNLTNIVKKLRAMYEPAPGNVFVAADFSALELRILALLANDELLIEAFRLFDAGLGPDIHIVNGCTVFKCAPEQVTDEARTFAKRFVYGLSYGAGPPKIFQTMSLLRDDNLKPVFPNITLSEIERVYEVWWKAHPAILSYQRKRIGDWKRHGYLATPWHGRRRYFLGGEDHEQLKNFDIQGGAADLQNTAVVALVQQYPFDFANNRGLVLQVHDQLVVECAEHEATRVQGLIEQSMTKKIGSMLIPAKAKIAGDWKAVS